MSQTQTMGKQEMERNHKESAAAEALVGVASSFAKKSSPPKATAKLPTNSASRREWDNQTAAPPDHGITGRYAPALDIHHGFTTTAAAAAAFPQSSFAAGPLWSSEPAGAAHHRGRDPAGFSLSTTTKTQQQTGTSNTAAQQQNSAAAVGMSMSSIGMGIDASFSTTGDATEAAYRAVRDAMERSAVRIPTSPSQLQNLSIHVKLGVPPKPSGEPMRVDVGRLAPLLPRSVSLQPVELTVGGLLIDHKEMLRKNRSESSTSEAEQHPTICSAVACVTLQQITTTKSAAADVEVPGAANHISQRSMAVDSLPAASPWAHLESSSPALTMPVQRRTLSTSSAPAPSTGIPNLPPTQVNVHRSNSMEVLALISGEIRERHLNSQMGINGMNLGGAATAALEHGHNEGESLASDGSNTNKTNAAYSYKKLAPGLTPKANKRIFVKHSYKDYSHEEHLPEEHYLVRTQDSPTRTPNAAFPLKLHETLTQIEQDGYGHIIGWLPHGRSFKIFQQQEFVNVVLPKYFVMTKKSSFLRQLNLYGFNRISVGPDGGSYYHEKFLRGLKFLCRRMTRQKVNGNGIRAAGNPDEEPNLSQFPTCPPAAHGAASCNSSVTHNENDSHADNSHVNAHESVPPLPQDGNKDSTMVTDENSFASHGSGAGGGGSKTSQSKPVRTQSSGTSGGGSSGQVSFPLKLQRLLDKMEAEGNTTIISWLPHGRAFLVHNVDQFVLDIMTQYFNQTKYSSFQRQLHMYNFQRITFGRDKGAYHHPNFQRGRPNLCLSMVRTRVNGKGCRRPGDPDAEPSFYEQEYLPAIPNGTVIEIPTDATGVGNDDDVEMKGASADDELGQTQEV